MDDGKSHFLFLPDMHGLLYKDVCALLKSYVRHASRILYL